MEAGAWGPARGQPHFGKSPPLPCPGRRRAGSKAWFLLTVASTGALRTLGHSSLVSEGGMRRYQSCLHWSGGAWQQTGRTLTLAQISNKSGPDLFVNKAKPITSLQSWGSYLSFWAQANFFLRYRSLGNLHLPFSISLICLPDPSKLSDGAALPDAGKESLICGLLTIFSP